MIKQILKFKLLILFLTKSLFTSAWFFRGLACYRSNTQPASGDGYCFMTSTTCTYDRCVPAEIDPALSGGLIVTSTAFCHVCLFLNSWPVHWMILWKGIVWPDEVFLYESSSIRSLGTGKLHHTKTITIDKLFDIKRLPKQIKCNPKKIKKLETVKD